MRTQHQTKIQSKPTLPLNLIFDHQITGLLERDFDDKDEYEYTHGLLDNIDRAQSHHSPYDIEDDAQEFYNRQINEDSEL